MSQLAGSSDSAAAFVASVGKEAVSLELTKDKWDEYKELVFTFTDGTQLMIFDEGQSCCESRYMTTDDDLAGFVGSTLLEAEVADAPNIIGGYGDHEVQFLHVKTSRGTFTVETHNEHNGYYGGFAVACRLVEP